MWVQCYCRSISIKYWLYLQIMRDSCSSDWVNCLLWWRSLYRNDLFCSLRWTLSLRLVPWWQEDSNVCIWVSRSRWWRVIILSSGCWRVPERRLFFFRRIITVCALNAASVGVTHLNGCVENTDLEPHLWPFHVQSQHWIYDNIWS